MKLMVKIALLAGVLVSLVGGATMGWAAASAHESAPSLAAMSATASSTPNAAIDSSTEAKYTAITPCRLADTRVAGGKLAAGTTRQFVVAGTAGFPAQGGTSGGCGIPTAATAVAATVVAVDETGSGFLRTWPDGGTAPVSSFLNFAPPAIVSSGVTLTVQGAVEIQAGAAATDVVIDVQGYYVKPMYAVVSSTGAIASKSRATAATELSTGAYEVTFDRNVSACAYAVTPKSTNEAVLAFPYSGSANSVFVEVTFNGTLEPASFSLTVTC